MTIGQASARAGGDGVALEVCACLSVHVCVHARVRVGVHAHFV